MARARYGIKLSTRQGYQEVTHTIVETASRRDHAERAAERVARDYAQRYGLPQVVGGSVWCVADEHNVVWANVQIVPC